MGLPRTGEHPTAWCRDTLPSAWLHLHPRLGSWLWQVPHGGLHVQSCFGCARGEEALIWAIVALNINFLKSQWPLGEAELPLRQIESPKCSSEPLKFVLWIFLCSCYS